VSVGFSDFPLSLWGAVNLPTYVLGALIIVLLPGPNSLYVLATAAQRGVRAGYRAAGGVFIGDTVLMILAAAGIASVLRAYPALFAVFKFSGAAYLAYLGMRMILGALRAPASEPNAAPAASAERAELSRPLSRALGISLMNPKAILFFVAFFVQFVDPSYPPISSAPCRQ
jgi:leucine efflux protein